MIVLVLTAADAGAIRDALPPGDLRTTIARDLAAEVIPVAALPELVIARPRWEYVECCYDAATADRCWRAFVRAWRARPLAPRDSGRRRSERLRRGRGVRRDVGRSSLI